MSWEIIHRATEFIVEEIGVTLKRSAFSPNIREREDHSVAVVDAEGRIVAQAEHIPVHLGSFYIGVKNILGFLEKEGVELLEGDIVVTNDPYISGTHLNDVMMLSPIHVDGKLVGYIATKAHYVDVGGPLPASLNPNAKTIYEEGVIVPPVKIVKKGEVDREILSIILSNFKTPDYAVGDIHAQIAAHRAGAQRVKELFQRFGNVLNAWSQAIEYTRKLVLMEYEKWPEGIYDAEDYLDWRGKLYRIRVRLEIRRSGIVADFTGTDNQVEEPINAVLGVTFAATSFAIRCALGKDMPVNHGFYSTISVTAPQGTLVNPVKPAPVGAGNLETSNRIADAVFLALSKALPGRIPAAASGTMMNVMIGGVHQGRYWSYYETVGGGTGARPFKDGVSGVHVNMTNTKNTPIEIAEREYPIMFTAYRIREGSGGRGKYRGGDGIIRAFKVLAPATLSIIASRFETAPWGLEGGEPGKPARVMIRRADGRVEEIKQQTVVLNPGDEVVIETPGGGGYGKPEKQ
ncbi:MAG: hydantoinase B/oxoprolinase family protein [Ignisphaera sp.]|nr:hydantoinase B/oxoprolinase family protein [Ignisphaera sp.]